MPAVAERSLLALKEIGVLVVFDIVAFADAIFRQRLEFLLELLIRETLLYLPFDFLVNTGRCHLRASKAEGPDSVLAISSAAEREDVDRGRFSF